MPHVRTRLTTLFLVSAPEEEEVPSSTSEPEETEETELQVATQQLTQDFLCQVIQEEEGRGKTADEGFCEQEVEPEKFGTRTAAQITPLSIILGKLPGQSRPGLQESLQSLEESETGLTADGEHASFIMTSSWLHFHTKSYSLQFTRMNEP